LVLEKIFDDLHNKYPNSPIALFSQLAEGVDTEVADFFLNLKEKTDRTYSLIVPLPFNLQDYRGRFPKKELDKFDSLLTKSDRHFVIKSDDQTPLNDLYRQGGQFMADNTLILIAIWDLIDNHKVGGTADIVNYKIQGLFSENNFSSNVFEPKGALISIPCNRESSTTKSEITLEDDYLTNLLEDTSIARALSKIEEFNQHNWDTVNLEISQNYLYPSDSSISPILKNLKTYYSLMDVSALDNQKVYKLILKAIFIAIVAVLGIMFLIFNFSGRWKNHKKYIENRMLAEAFRIQFFWNMSNLNEPVSKYILRVYKSELGWIKHILNSAYVFTYENNTIENLNNLMKVKTHWIENQKEYFLRKVNDYENQKKMFDIISYVFLFIAIIVLFAIFIVNQINSEHAWLKGLIIFDTVVFGVFGLTKGYYEKRGYDQISNQHVLMQTIYKTADEQINAIMKSDLPSEIKYKKIQELLLIIGEEALNENGYWYTIFKDKEPEIEGFGI